MATPNPTFSITQFRCDDCREEFYIYGDHTMEKQQAEHIECHRRGRCLKCSHWRKGHARTTKSVRDYLRSDQEWVCNSPMGMGDFCGCPGDGKMEDGE